MATIKNFEDIIAWQKARILSAYAHNWIGKIEKERDFELKNQLRASSGSIMDNIAEGFERQGNKEFIHFLYISKGSCGEFQSQLYRAFDLGYINQEEFDKAYAQALEISKILHGLIQAMQQSDYKGFKFKQK